MPTNRHVQQAEAEVYASTLIDAAQAEGGAEAVMAVRSQLEQISLFNNSSVDLKDVMEDPGYTSEQRGTIVRNTFAACDPNLVSVLGVMAERGDFGRLTKVKNRFNELIAEKLNINVVDVTTRVPLDDHLREVIKKKAAADFGTDIYLVEHIDEKMLGGIIMYANGKRIDASVNTMLAHARNVLKEN